MKQGVSMKSKSLGCLIGVVAVVLFILIFLNPIVIIPAGYVGVKVLFGKVYPTVLSNGLHIVNPLLSIEKMDVRLQSYTMSIAPTEGEMSGDDAIDALTSEGLLVRLDLTAWFMLKPDEAPKVYEQIGVDYVEKVVRPLLRTAIRDMTVKYTAENIYSTKRDEFVKAINDHATELSANKGIEIDRILLRNVKLPNEVQSAINTKITASQESQRMEFILTKERQEKDRKIIEAEGIREANRIIAQGLTPSYISWYRIEMLKSLANSQNTTFLIIPEDLKSVPMIMQPQSGK